MAALVAECGLDCWATVGEQPPHDFRHLSFPSAVWWVQWLQSPAQSDPMNHVQNWRLKGRGEEDEGKFARLDLFHILAPITRRDNSIHRIRKVSRDERNKSWYLDFGKFFTSSLRAVTGNPSVLVGRENDSKSGKEVITIRVNEGDSRKYCLIAWPD